MPKATKDVKKRQRSLNPASNATRPRLTSTGKPSTAADKGKRKTDVIIAAERSKSSAEARTPSGPGKQNRQPANWPAGVAYLPDRCQPSALLPPHLAAAFCVPFPASTDTSAAASASSSSSISPLKDLMIRRITHDTPFQPHPLLQNKHHPALGQYGLFATRELPARTLVCPYLGVVHTEAETDEGSEYDAKVWAKVGEVPGVEGEDVGLGIDATHAGNLARFVNDFRGITQRANVTFEDWPTPASDESDNVDAAAGHAHPRGLALFTGAAGVPAGAELCVSYGKSFWEARGVLPISSHPKPPWPT
ncbi:hypothetical protein OC844_007013 [Tilletia horrida]|nr:hypothetical protein OC844_007013 [Tilletia horrida]